jgi:glutamine amidotransferase
VLTIIDYGSCNISAVSNMLDRLGQPHRVASEDRHLVGASRFILPGTGSFDTCITNLRQGGLLNVLEAAVLNQKLPVLGICVGAQILGRRSQEGV